MIPNRGLLVLFLLVTALLGFAIGFLAIQGNALVDRHQGAQDCAAIGGCN